MMVTAHRSYPGTSVPIINISSHTSLKWHGKRNILRWRLFLPQFEMVTYEWFIWWLKQVNSQYSTTFFPLLLEVTGWARKPRDVEDSCPQVTWQSSDAEVPLCSHSRHGGSFTSAGPEARQEVATAGRIAEDPTQGVDNTMNTGLSAENAPLIHHCSPVPGSWKPSAYLFIYLFIYLFLMAAPAAYGSSGVGVSLLTHCAGSGMEPIPLQWPKLLQSDS